jgi:hypothetical protein
MVEYMRAHTIPARPTQDRLLVCVNEARWRTLVRTASRMRPVAYSGIRLTSRPALRAFPKWTGRGLRKRCAWPRPGSEAVTIHADGPADEVIAPSAWRDALLVGGRDRAGS